MNSDVAEASGVNPSGAPAGGRNTCRLYVITFLVSLEHRGALATSIRFSRRHGCTPGLLQNFVVHAEGFHPVFEGAKFIERADEIVEEDDVAGLEMARERGENEKRRAEKVRVEMDHQAAGEIVAVMKGSSVS